MGCRYRHPNPRPKGPNVSGVTPPPLPRFEPNQVLDVGGIPSLFHSLAPTPFSLQMRVGDVSLFAPLLSRSPFMPHLDSPLLQVRFLWF
jgi:hypothetical protein